ncbi:anaphase-promoting complex subunit 11-like isoform X1 [Dreissena polymorpha]|uniref:anaphase-promoting complex subunit 11-like isoform X1 n=1 Tax=Dreissena polymorpha TaxID=45954 RepID=UPI0022650FAE|nr:anaphase-promoting complex subunit 11-like isoform X1 [Dreissena polymorpha]
MAGNHHQLELSRLTDGRKTATFDSWRVLSYISHDLSYILFKSILIGVFFEKSWTAVATWRWVANDDNCGICRMAFDGCCPDCKLPGDDCPLVWGECSHCFHIHCIVKWLNSQQVNQLCPMCRQDWKFKE